jgi:colanic acid/amylovoran biosynthesis glycosyltransferase
VVEEAESFSLPVIATNTGGIPDGIVDGKTGFIIPEKNPEAIYQKMLFLVKNKDTALKMGKEGKLFVDKNYNNKFLTQKLVGLTYED